MPRGRKKVAPAKPVDAVLEDLGRRERLLLKAINAAPGDDRLKAMAKTLIELGILAAGKAVLTG